MKTKAFPPKFNSFEDLLRSFTQDAPDRTVLIYEEDGVPVRKSRADFAESVLARAEEMRSFGMTCLGVLCDGSLDCIETIFASAAAGLQTVLLDENASDTLLQEQIRQTDIDILWSSDLDLVEELTPYLTEGIPPKAENSDPSCEGSDILFFTSGTTASSKAVVLTDRSLLAAAYNGSCMLPLSPDDTLLCMLPLNHVFGFVCGLLWGLSCGACVSLGRGARHYLDDCDFYRPTAVSVVPMLLGFLLQQKCVNPELRLILVGAGDCAPELLRAATDLGLHVSFGYGLTETSSGVAISVQGDPYAMEVCPDDTITLADDGEILIQAPTCMMQGYYKRPDATRAVLRDGVLHTGDLGCFDEDGRLHITGRKKDMLVLSDGTKIFLPEYESALMQTLEHMELAVVLKGGRPALIYCGSGDASAVMEKLRPLMRRQPRGKQIAEVVFTDEPLPRTQTGKIKRWELQQKVMESA